MGSQTAAGSSLAISTMLPTTHDASGYAALTFIEIGQIEKLGTFGAAFAKVEYQPLKGAKQKYKGSADYGALQPSIAIDTADAGQALMLVAADDETQKLYSFRVTLQDGAKRYFRGRVFGSPETAQGADTMLLATPTVEICTKVVRLDAGVTPAPSPTLSQPSITPPGGTVGTTFTAVDGTVTNGALTGRRWLLGTTAIGTGTTVTPNAAGSLTLENTALGTNGAPITSTSNAVTVAAATPTPSPTPTVTISAAQSQVEGNSGATLYTYTVSRSAASGAVAVPWSFTAGTTNAADYTSGAVPAGGNVNMADGVSTGTIVISVNGDTIVEADEMFTVLISTPSGYVAGSTTSATGTILNDDVADQTPTVDYFANNIASEGYYGQASGPGIFYDATSNKTLKFTEGFNKDITTRRSMFCQTYNHATKVLSPLAKVFDSGLKDDGHGQAGSCISPFNRRGYSVGGAHGGPFKIGMSAPDDFGSWTQIADIPVASDGAGWCYPKMIPAGNILHLWARKTSDNGMPLVYFRGTIGSDGLPVWSAPIVLIDVSTAGRIYAAVPITMSTSGNEVVARHLFVYADQADSYRQDVFLMDHDTSAGLLKSVTNPSYSRSTGTGMPMVTARANLRIVDQATGGFYTNIPSMAYDSNGGLHVLYMHDADGNNVVVNPMDWFEIVMPAGSTTFGAPVKTHQTKQRYDVSDIVPLPSSEMHIGYTSLSTYGFSRGGDISRIKSKATGVWDTTGELLRAAAANAPLDRFYRVENARPEFRYGFSEQAIPPFQGNTGGADTLTLGNLRDYGGGDSGKISFPFSPHPKSQGWATRAQTAPSTAYYKAVDAWIVALANLGLLATLDILHLGAGLTGGDAQLAAMDFIGKSDGTYRDLTVNGGITFAQVAGRSGYAFKGDGTSGWLGTGYVPSTGGVNYTLNSAGLYVGATLEILDANPIVMGRTAAQTTGGDLLLSLREPSTSAGGLRFNSAGGMAVTNSQSLGFYAARRTAANNVNVYRDGTAIQSGTTASSAVPAVEIKYLGDGATRFNANQIYGMGIGSAFAAGDAIAVASAWRRLAVDLGLAGV